MEIRRDRYLQALVSRMHNGMIKVITGIRRVGKSYLLFKLFRDYLLAHGVKEDHLIAIELDDRANAALRDPDALLAYVRSRIHDGEIYYVLLDEVQFLSEFEEVLNSLLHQNNIDIYVTGSNSKFLSKDVITEFRGRGDELHVYPLTFREFYQAVGGGEVDAWKEYEVFGGLPIVATLPDQARKSAYLKNLFTETYLKDILERNRVKGSAELEEVIDVMASSVGSLANPSRIANTFLSEKRTPIAKETVKNYLTYLEDAFLISEARRYDVKGRKYINTPMKYYFEDVGLRNARLNFRQIDEPQLLENIVYNELRYRGYNVDVGMVEVNQSQGDHYIRKQLEIDFIVNRVSQRYYIQVAQALSTPEKQEQELRSLNRIRDGFRKVIIRMDNRVSYTDQNGILHLALFDFLLDRKGFEEHLTSQESVGM